MLKNLISSGFCGHFVFLEIIFLKFDTRIFKMGGGIYKMMKFHDIRGKYAETIDKK